MQGISRQKDWIARLVCIPAAAFVASHVVFTKLWPWNIDYRFPWPYFFTVGTVMFCCWEVNWRLFEWMDRQLPFYVNPLRRITRQITLNALATMLTFLVVFPIAQRIYRQQWPTVSILMTGMVVCATIATIFNGAYIVFYLMKTIYWEKQREELPSLPDLTQKALSPTLIKVKLNKAQLLLEPSEIAYFYSTAGVVLMVKRDGSKVTTDYDSLNEIVPELPSDYFFPLSRQIVAGRGAIRALKNVENRKMLVSLIPALHQNQTVEEVVVSRYRSAELRKWLDKAPTPDHSSLE